MARRKKRNPEEIVAKLRQVEVSAGQGTPVTDAVRASPAPCREGSHVLRFDAEHGRLRVALCSCADVSHRGVFARRSDVHTPLGTLRGAAELTGKDRSTPTSRQGDRWARSRSRSVPG
jgi:hypothetical protein